MMTSTIEEKDLEVFLLYKGINERKCQQESLELEEKL